MLLGFDASRSLAWFAPLDEVGSGSELCARHAASMRVPKGWWLDDRRVDAPQLFNHEPFAHSTTPEVGRVSKQSPAAPEERPLPLDEPAAEPPSEWKPVFEKGDDLDGLLDADSPLLGRAFRGRPRAQTTRDAT